MYLPIQFFIRWVFAMERSSIALPSIIHYHASLASPITLCCAPQYHIISSSLLSIPKTISIMLSYAAQIQSRDRAVVAGHASSPHSIVQHGVQQVQLGSCSISLKLDGVDLRGRRVVDKQ